jgi:hypothetical protein
MDAALTREQWLDIADDVPCFWLKVNHVNGKRREYVNIVFSDGFEVWQVDEWNLMLELWDLDFQDGDRVDILGSLDEIDDE